VEKRQRMPCGWAVVTVETGTTESAVAPVRAVSDPRGSFVEMQVATSNRGRRVYQNESIKLAVCIEKPLLFLIIRRPNS
jgi:hypothetical protein